MAWQGTSTKEEARPYSSWNCDGLLTTLGYKETPTSMLSYPQFKNHESGPSKITRLYGLKTMGFKIKISACSSFAFVSGALESYF